MKMSTIKRKWDIAFILFVLVSAMLLGSGKSETTINPKGPVKMTYWANAPTNKAWMEEMARRFQKSNTELNFELEVTQFPGPQLAEKVIGTFIAKSGTPDFVAIQTPDIAKYLKGHFAQNNLVDLKSLINDPRFDDLLYTEQWMWENKYYGINFDMSLSIYYYRKDIFDEVGIDPSTWKTWEDYIRDGEKLKASKGSFMSVQDVGGWNQYFILMYLNGGGLFDKNGTIFLNCKENIEALQLWIDFVNKYKIHWPTATFYGPGTTERSGKARLRVL
jgi:ABC-type glycerol-3-phosphate transport system substrate-binding protein